tara:strand:- start:509 stop:676 length:168 start_codon:yes stop_codon:yes gene_type:complete
LLVVLQAEMMLVAEVVLVVCYLRQVQMYVEQQLTQQLLVQVQLIQEVHKVQVSKE